MTPDMDDLPVMSFTDGAALRAWLDVNHVNSPGLWVRIFRRQAGVPSVTFEDLLEQGLCFGWSESTRIRGDDTSYLQRFAPRRRKGTASERNKALAQRLSSEGKMTVSGLEALRMTDQSGPQANQTLVRPRPRAGPPPRIVTDVGSDAAPNDRPAQGGDD